MIAKIYNSFQWFLKSDIRLAKFSVKQTKNIKEIGPMHPCRENSIENILNFKKENSNCTFLGF